MSTENLLQVRGNTHGDFDKNAEVTQHLKQYLRMMQVLPLNVMQQEALDNICQKIGRIVVGNPNHDDHWDDIAGYAKLPVKFKVQPVDELPVKFKVQPVDELPQSKPKISAILSGGKTDDTRY